MIDWFSFFIGIGFTLLVEVFVIGGLLYIVGKQDDAMRRASREAKKGGNNED